MADDDPEDRMLFEDAIQEVYGKNMIEFAENGLEALSMLSSPPLSADSPCLIVLDLNMPKMNGTQTLQKIKEDERLRDIPVVIYSTSINPLEKEKCLRLGAQAYITKPVSFKESISTARRLISYCKEL